MNKNKHHCSIFLFAGWLIMLLGCQHAPSSFLKKAMQMENVSVDSIFFYLQQIDKPENLSSKEQGDYYFLFYKATLWKTGKPIDSLLQTAIRHYTQNGQLSQCLQARVEQSASYLYRNRPDSTLLLSDALLRERLLNDTLRTQLYGLKRAAYSRNKDYEQALNMADSSRQLTRKHKDTLAYFSASKLYLNLLEKVQGYDRYTQEALQLMGEFGDSPNYQYLNYHILENLLTASLERKDFRAAQLYLRQMSAQRHSRHVIPHYFLLRGKSYAALNQLDSAKYYYQQAATSSSDFIAVEANALLFNLINEKEYPEQAFYIRQKENRIKDDILTSTKTEIQRREYNELKLKNELYQLHLKQREKELWMLGIATVLLGVGFIVFFFYQKEKKKRLQRENLLLHQEAELSGLREKEIRLQNKEAELREALFRRIAFFRKLPSLHNDESQDEAVSSRKIVVTDAEWGEVIAVVNEAFDHFAARLEQTYPLLNNKDIGFCCLVKINVNVQDLSDIYCVSKAAITKRKYRIKTDKLGITDENVSLDGFLKVF
ncbi:hypothetical protein [uncultured Bacteroides sp.]|uniref:hypothetical protein n=1 Tax=uncultured Bacteroides sp. TaxID=162156 RepID=UPI0025D3AB7C|nr:hypothetical protein [uncultured Bacteroides sp.]